MSATPYRTAAPVPRPPVSIEGELLVVEATAKLPRVCLKCGATKELVSRTETMAQAGAAGGVGAGGGVAGALLAQSFRHDPAMAAVVALFAVIAILAVATVMQRSTPSADVDLVLCDACDVRWSEGKIAQRRTLWGLAGVGVLVLLGLALSAWPIAAAGLLGFAVVLGFALRMKLPKRFVTATRIAQGHVWLGGVSPEALARIAKRLAKKARAA